MTYQENQDLKELAEKVDKLPEEIIKRLDDRYLKKDDAPKQFYTRMEGRFFSSVLGIIVAVLGIWDFFRNSK